MQFVYWYAPLWQVIVVAAIGLLLLGWLLVLAGRRPGLSRALAAVDPALASQPAIYFDHAGGFVALNAGAEVLLGELRLSDTDALRALADALWEAEVEASASQLDRLRDALFGYLKCHPKLWTGLPLRVHFIGFGDSSLNIDIMAWFDENDWDRFLELRHDVLLQTMRIIEQHGARIAFPTRTVHLLGAAKP